MNSYKNFWSNTKKIWSPKNGCPLHPMHVGTCTISYEIIQATIRKSGLYNFSHAAYLLEAKDSIPICILRGKMQYRFISWVSIGATEKHLFAQVLVCCVSCRVSFAAAFAVPTLEHVCCPGVRAHSLRELGDVLRTYEQRVPRELLALSPPLPLVDPPLLGHQLPGLISIYLAGEDKSTKSVPATTESTI
jgi:hypothetical protein